jgi:hypothetical protein
MKLIDGIFRNNIGRDIFYAKYSHEGCETWEKLAHTLTWEVCGDLLPRDTVEAIEQMIAQMKFIPGGRYLYYAGREAKFYNNCALGRCEEDSREDWSHLTYKTTSWLMTGMGLGFDYSIYRPRGRSLSRTGGVASGPLPAMGMVNEIGRRVMQGGSRRSAIYASLDREHDDVMEFMAEKDWDNRKIAGTDKSYGDLKRADFSFPCPLDNTNVSVNYSDKWLSLPDPASDEVFLKNCEYALRNGEPGFSFNFGDKARETLRNAPVAGSTHVYTSEGIRQVIDIVNTPVTLWTGKQWASDVVFRCTKENTSTISVNMTGGRQIVCDPDHEFLVERWSGKGKSRTLDTIERVPAKDLQEDDILHVSLPTYGSPNTSDYMYVLGYAYGDGSFSRGGRCEITFCSPESKEIARGLAAFFNTYGTVNWDDSRGYTRVYFSKDVFGYPRSKETVGDEALNESFIAGLFDADGNYDASQNAIRLCSKHEGFLHDIRRALECMGILSNVSKNGSSTYGGSEVYQLVICREYNNLFRSLIPTRRLSPTEHDAYRKSSVRVLSVSEGETQDVFCCDVGVDEHTFMAEGVIISNCCEVTSEDDSDICNLGSLNLSRIETLEEFTQCVELATAFLICGTLKAQLPTQKMYIVREKNRRLGLGLMGVHEWLVTRGYRYQMNDELRSWMEVYRDGSRRAADEYAARLSISRPVACRAIAPTGTIGMLAGTTTGIEPIFAVSFKRIYLKNNVYHYQYVVESAAREMMATTGCQPDDIETALSLASDPERRISFQADMQDYVDMAISSTINMPAWGTPLNSKMRVPHFASILAKYAPRLRGMTVYPDAARGGQPLTPVPYSEALKNVGKEFTETIIQHSDICDISGKGGHCGS